jgi:ABC-type phosphate transport system auxiliary subunit
MRRLLRVVGFASTAAGAVLVFTPLSVSGGGLTVVVLVGSALLAGGVGGLAALSRSSVTVADGSLPDPSDRGRSVPGDEVDRELAGLSTRDEETQERLRARIEAVGVGVLADQLDCSRSTARERLVASDWTDDDAAQAFFQARPPSRRDRLRTLLRGEPTFSRRARAALAALREVAA